MQIRERAREEELLEKERVAYAQIDWHDFVVVETVDYQPGEMGNFPPATTPEDVGARVIAQERQERLDADAASKDLAARILEDEARVLPGDGSATRDDVHLAPPVPSDTNVDEVAMDEDSDEESAKAVVTVPKKDVPMPPDPENVLIRRDYDPKAAKPSVSKPAETYFKSPFTGELIPASAVDEHMRIANLDPRWIEQRQRERKEREEQEEVLATGSSINAHLKRLADRRTDIFGSGADEASIGRTVGEEVDEEPLGAVDTTWDGHMNSKESTAKRALDISVEDQLRTMQNTQA